MPMFFSFASFYRSFNPRLDIHMHETAHLSRKYLLDLKVFFDDCRRVALVACGSSQTNPYS